VRDAIEQSPTVPQARQRIGERLLDRLPGRRDTQRYFDALL
jgi:hypothetical protein